MTSPINTVSLVTKVHKNSLPHGPHPTDTSPPFNYKMGSEDNAQSLRTAIILYGSETGNSQDLAEELARLTERLHFITHVSELDAVKAVPNPRQKVMDRIRMLRSNLGVA